MKTDQILTFVSIVLGLGFCRLLDSLGRTIERRKEIHHFWLIYVWACASTAAMMQIWWGMWEHANSNVAMPTHLGYGLLLVGISAAWFFMAELLFPDDLNWFIEKFNHQGRGNQRAWYFENKPWFFSAVALTVLLSGLNGALFRGQDYTSHLQHIRLLAVALFIFLAFEKLRDTWRRTSLHALGCSLSIILLIRFISKNGA